MKNIGRFFIVVTIILFNGCSCDHPFKTGKIIKVETRAEFNEFIKSKKPVVAKFSAVWCTACKAMDPVFAKAADKYYEDVKFIDVDVDKVGGMAEEFEIKGIPAFIYFKDGKQFKKIEGTLPQSDLNKSIESFK